MGRFLLILLLVSLLGGGWFLLNRYEIASRNGEWVIRARHDGVEGTRGRARRGDGLPPAANRRTIRIATFNAAPLDAHKLNRRQAVAVIASVVREFDIVAVQGVRRGSPALLNDLLDTINATGRHYALSACPTASRIPHGTGGIFLFDRASIEADPSMVYSVTAPAGHLASSPLVAAFRARGPDPEAAFTFTLINVRVDPDNAARELDLLADVYRAVRDDGREEDDIIILGSLAADEGRYGALGRIPDITWAISGIPTTTRSPRSLDNILFNRRATVEFTGRSGVVDLVRQFDLSVADAERIAAHLPAWAEFSVFEGGDLLHLAGGR